MRGLFLFLFMSLCSTLVADSFRVTSVDPPLDAAYPGGRGRDALIVYTPQGPRESTGTNPYGIEAVVRDGIVTAIQDRDSRIPPDGVVLSGHGRAADWIRLNLREGSPVQYDESHVQIDTSADGKWAGLLYRLKRVADGGPGGLPNSTVALQAGPLHHLYSTMVDEPTDSMVLELQERVENLEKEAWTLALEQMPSPEGEIRAVWHRLEEHTRAEIIQLVEAWATAGVNAAFPETIFASQAIYPDPTGLYTHFPQFEGLDALQVLIEECHKRGIEVHAWVHCFFIGIEGSTVEPPLLAERRPEWLAKDRQGRTVSEIEPGFMYVNPSLPEVREAMINVYTALARNYDIDGFQFDYIRYSNAPDWQEGWDYSDATRKRVELELGFDPMTITPDSDPENWLRWIAWRENTITSFVRDTSHALREIKPGLILSADVFPELDSAIAHKGQNWVEWGRRGYLDAMFPMAYALSTDKVREDIAEGRRLLGDATPIVAGLGPFMGLTTSQLIDQVNATRDAGVIGQCLFSWGTTSEEARWALGIGPWRNHTPPQWKRAE